MWKLKLSRTRNSATCVPTARGIRIENSNSNFLNSWICMNYELNWLMYEMGRRECNVELEKWKSAVTVGWGCGSTKSLRRLNRRRREKVTISDSWSSSDQIFHLFPNPISNIFKRICDFSFIFVVIGCVSLSIIETHPSLFSSHKVGGKISDNGGIGSDVAVGGTCAFFNLFFLSSINNQRIQLSSTAPLSFIAPGISYILTQYSLSLFSSSYVSPRKICPLLCNLFNPFEDCPTIFLPISQKGLFCSLLGIVFFFSEE